MSTLLGFARGTIGFIVGMLAGMTVLALGRQLVFGAGLGPSPQNLAFAAQIGVAVAWFAGAAVATWVALGLSKRRLSGLVTTAWLFQMVWLSPEVRPVEFEMRMIVAASVAIAGLGVYLVWRTRQEQSGRATVRREQTA